jgi:hypothetical protein
MCYIFIFYFIENEQYQLSSSRAVDLFHATIHLLQQQILLVQQIVRGQQIINKLLTKLIMSNGESKPLSAIGQKYSKHFILPAKSVAEVCDIEEKLQLSASRQLMVLINLLTQLLKITIIKQEFKFNFKFRSVDYSNVGKIAE